MVVVSRLGGGERLVTGMPGGKRTDCISERDLQVLGFIVRYGVVSREAVAIWAGTGRAVTAARERRLREAGLVEVRRGLGEGARLVLATRDGLRALGRRDLRVPAFSLPALRHECAVAELAARLERLGAETMSEREILARERVEGERLYSAQLAGGRAHRADLVCSMGVGAPQAVEVELVAKAAGRLDELLRAWRRAAGEGRLSRIVYHCHPRVGDVVRRAVERTGTAAVIRVEEL